MDATLQVRGLDAEVAAELKTAPDTIRGRLEALRSLGGGASHDDVVTEIRKIRES
ncbi:hypothetical protein ACIBG4_04075 [Nonomuraea sp. NPDC050383]|uniref:hypothetical protein n=1 Tax=Nonomuraea sp. NPDC050383 TaxID=3364362 RepID=UPI0037A9C341